MFFRSSIVILALFWIKGVTKRELAQMNSIYEKDLDSYFSDDPNLGKAKKRAKSTKDEHVAKFKCQYCERKFTRKDNIKPHLWTAHKLGKAIKKNLSCDFCNATFDRQSVLDNHIKAVHLKMKDHSCNVCKYVTSNRPDLIRHMKKHEKPESS